MDFILAPWDKKRFATFLFFPEGENYPALDNCKTKIMLMLKSNTSATEE